MPFITNFVKGYLIVYIPGLVLLFLLKLTILFLFLTFAYIGSKIDDRDNIPVRVHPQRQEAPIHHNPDLSDHRFQDNRN